MTDITELAQRARINAECGEHLSPAETMELVQALESEKRICATWRKTAKSTGEKLEKSEKTSEARREAIDRTHNMFVRERERANAAEEALEKAKTKADVYDMLRDDYGLREKGVGLADFVDWQANRIAELEESHAQVIQSRDHYKRITDEGLRRLAESRTVKLPSLPRVGANTEWYQGFAAGAESMRSDCAHAINAAGIKVETE
ncbi:hypothetical protein [Klebsiella quasipneumoniae]